MAVRDGGWFCWALGGSQPQASAKKKVIILSFLFPFFSVIGYVSEYPTLHQFSSHNIANVLAPSWILVSPAEGVRALDSIGSVPLSLPQLLHKWLKAHLRKKSPASVSSECDLDRARSPYGSPVGSKCQATAHCPKVSFALHMEDDSEDSAHDAVVAPTPIGAFATKTSTAKKSDPGANTRKKVCGPRPLTALRQGCVEGIF